MKIHVGDIGARVLLTVKDETGTPVDLSTCTVLQIIFLKPDETYIVASMQFVTDGTDGKVRFRTRAGDMDQPGIWRAQVYFERAAGNLYLHSDVFQFRVYP